MDKGDPPRRWYIISYWANTALGFMVLGYCYGYYNAFTKILPSQYEYYNKTTIESRYLFNSVVSGLIPLGATFGSFLIKPLASRGRRHAIMINGCVFILGSAICMIFHLSALIIGRFIQGLAWGGFVTVCPLLVSEITPPSLSGPVGAFSQFGTVTGIVLAFSTAFILPLPSDPDSQTTGLWRILFFLPALLPTIQIILFLTVFRHDSPRFYTKVGNHARHEHALSKLFKVPKIAPEQPEEQNDSAQSSQPIQPIHTSQPVETSKPIETINPSNPEEVPHHERPVADENYSVSEESVRVKEPIGHFAVPAHAEVPHHHAPGEFHQHHEHHPHEEEGKKWPAHYKKALMIGICLSVFHQTTGINAVTFFSNDIFTQGQTGEGPEMRGRIGTLLSGVGETTGVIISIFLLRFFTRKTLFLLSEFLILTLMTIIGILSLFDAYIAVIVLILCFVWVYNWGMGSVMWLYTAEILDDFGWSVVGLVNMFSTFVFAGCSNLGFKYFTVPGFYFFLASLQIVCITFIILLVKETKGKTKDECAVLYKKKQ